MTSEQELTDFIALVDQIYELAMEREKFHVGYFAEEENRKTYDRWRSEGN